MCVSVCIPKPYALDYKFIYLICLNIKISLMPTEKQKKESRAAVQKLAEDGESLSGNY